jgi:transposase
VTVAGKGGRPPRYTPDQVEQILEAIRAGESCAAIARRLGGSKSTVQRVAAAAGIHSQAKGGPRPLSSTPRAVVRRQRERRDIVIPPRDATLRGFDPRETGWSRFGSRP